MRDPHKRDVTSGVTDVTSGGLHFFPHAGPKCLIQNGFFSVEVWAFTHKGFTEYLHVEYYPHLFSCQKKYFLRKKCNAHGGTSARRIRGRFPARPGSRPSGVFHAASYARIDLGAPGVRAANKRRALAEEPGILQGAARGLDPANRCGDPRDAGCATAGVTGRLRNMRAKLLGGNPAKAPDRVF